MCDHWKYTLELHVPATTQETCTLVVMNTWSRPSADHRQATVTVCVHNTRLLLVVMVMELQSQEIQSESLA